MEATFGLQKDPSFPRPPSEAHPTGSLQLVPGIVKIICK